MQITHQQIEKISRLTVQGVADSDIADIMHLSLDQLNEIREHEVYRTKFSEMVEDKLDTFNTINDGLDNIEMMSISQIMSFLKHSVDPDFALKALAVVNRATRKGHVNNKPLDVPVGGRTTIDLSRNFVVQLTEGRDSGKQLPPMLEQKSENSLAIDRVENLLTRREEPVVEMMLATAIAGE